jgi:hypothetical protein
MGCCGHGRAALRARRTTRRPAGTGPGHAPAHLGSQPPVLVRLVHGAPLRLRGPATGAIYDFTPAQPLQSVDSDDAPALLRDGLLAVVVEGERPVA